MRNLGCFGSETEENVQPGGKSATVFVPEQWLLVVHKRGKSIELTFEAALPCCAALF